MRQMVSILQASTLANPTLVARFLLNRSDIVSTSGGNLLEIFPCYPIPPTRFKFRKMNDTCTREIPITYFGPDNDEHEAYMDVNTNVITASPILVDCSLVQTVPLQLGDKSFIYNYQSGIAAAINGLRPIATFLPNHTSSDWISKTLVFKQTVMYSWSEMPHQSLNDIAMAVSRQQRLFRLLGLNAQQSENEAVQKVSERIMDIGFFGFLRGLKFSLFQIWVFAVCVYVTITALARHCLPSAWGRYASIIDAMSTVANYGRYRLENRRRRFAGAPPVPFRPVPDNVELQEITPRVQALYVQRHQLGEPTTTTSQTHRPKRPTSLALSHVNRPASPGQPGYQASRNLQRTKLLAGLFTCSLPAVTSLPVIQIQLGYNNQMTLIDTGCVYSLVSETLADSFPLENRISVVAEAQAINNKTIRFTQALVLNLNFLGYIAQHSFLIFPDSPYPLILGSDFLTLHEVSLDYKHQAIQIKNRTIKFINHSIAPVGLNFVQSKTNLKSSVERSIKHLEKIPWNNSTATPLQRQHIMTLLEAYADVFSTSDYHVGALKGFEFEIDTGDAPPVQQRPYPMPFKKREILDSIIQQLLANDIIEPSNSNYSSPVVLVEKKDGTHRLAVDYRKLNRNIRDDRFPMPLIQQLLEEFHGVKYFTKLDLSSAYHHLIINKNSRYKTAFVCSSGLFNYKRLPFGLSSAPAIFSRALKFALRDLQMAKVPVLNYLDDILVYTKGSFFSHLQTIEKVLAHFRSINLLLKPSKCEFCRDKLNFLGFLISKDGIEADPDKVAKIKNFERPTTLKALKGFIALCSYYRSLIPNFSKRALPLTRLTRQENLINGSHFEWSEASEKSFNDLRTTLLSDVVLAFPDFSGPPFIIHCDASMYAFGAILSQRQNGKERPICFASKTLSPAESRYSATEREACCVCYSFAKFHSYIWGSPIELVVDCEPLKYLLTADFSTNSRLCKYQLRLQGYNISIRYVPGKTHTAADFLSRLPEYTKESKTKSLCLLKSSDDQPEVFEALYIPEMSAETLSELQEKDPELKPLIHYLKSQKLPTDAKIANQILKHAEEFALDQGVLFHLETLPVVGKTWQTVVPKACQYAVYFAFHIDSISGHSGPKHTEEKIRRRYWWRGLPTDIKTWAQGCQLCQQMKSPARAKVPIRHIKNYYKPFQIMGMDIVGPWKRTIRNNAYLIVFTCYLTKFPEAVPIPNTSAQTCAAAFVLNVCFRWQIPTQLICDNAAYFKSRFFDEVCKLLRIYRLYSAPYSPWSMGQTERNQSVLVRTIATMADSDNWDLFVAPALFAVRSTPNSSTGISPYHCVFGFEPNTPLDVIFERQITPYAPDDVPEHLASHAMRQIELWKIAKENITKAQIEMQRKMNVNAKETRFQVGQKVWLIDPVTPVGESKKLCPKFRGPYRIVKLTNVNAWLVPPDKPSSKFIESHLNNLKIWHPPHIPLQNVIPVPLTEAPNLFEYNNNEKLVQKSHPSLTDAIPTGQTPDLQPEIPTNVTPPEGRQLRSRFIPR